LRNRAAAAAAILAVPLLALALTAWLLGQFGGHPIEGGRFSLTENLLQICDGIGAFVLLRSGPALGLLCAAIVIPLLSLRSPAQSANRFVLLFTGVSLSLLAAAFSVTWMNGFISEPRHLLIVPLLVVPALVSCLVSSNTVLASTAALLVLIAPMWRTVVPDASVAAADSVPIGASISPLPGFGKTAVIDGRMLIGPIEWEEPEGGYSTTGAPRWGPVQTGGLRPAIPR
jgi:hypothetical protein